MVRVTLVISIELKNLYNRGILLEIRYVSNITHILVIPPLHMRTARTLAPVIGILLLASPVFAQSVDAQIAALLAQLKALQAQIALLQGQSMGANACVTLSYNLYADQTDATTGGDISRLQQFLGSKVTGYFGPLTEAAVQRWQAAHGVVSSGMADTTGFGYVGPKTRAAMSCGSMQAGTAVNVSCPLFPAPTCTSNQSYSEKRGANGCVITRECIGKMASIKVDVDGDYFINLVYENLPMSKIMLTSVDTGSRFDIDDNVQGSGAAELDEHNKKSGKYYIVAIAHQTGEEVARSEIFFLGTNSVVETQSPVLELTATPSYIAPGQSATVIWSSKYANKCSAYENGSPAQNSPETVSLSGSFTQTFYETKTYTYTCGSAGGYTTKSVTVTTSNQPAPSITVLSPNGNENVKMGTMYTISWTAQNIPANTNLAFSLVTPDGKEYRIKDAVAPATSGSFQWTMNGTACWGTQCAENIMKVGDTFKLWAVIYTPANSCFDNQWSNGACPSGMPQATRIAEDLSDQFFFVVQ